MCSRTKIFQLKPEIIFPHVSQRRVLSCKGSVWSLNVKIDVIGVLSVCFFSMGDPCGLFLLCHLFSFSSRLHASTLTCSLSAYLLSLSPRWTSLTSSPLPLLLPSVFSFSPTVLQCYSPSVPCSRWGLIYFHYKVKREAFVCQQHRSHGAMLGVAERWTSVPAILPAIHCMWWTRLQFLCERTSLPYVSLSYLTFYICIIL